MDDFVLNFAAPSASSKSAAKAPKQKGGRWTDRVKANKNNGPKKSNKPSSAGPSSSLGFDKPISAASTTAVASKPAPAPAPRPATTSTYKPNGTLSKQAAPPSKRPKFDFNEDAGEEYDEDDYEDRVVSKAGATKSAEAPGGAINPKQIISSLFTSNPKSHYVEEDSEMDYRPNHSSFQEPSNAPLASNPSTTTQSTSLIPSASASASFLDLGLSPLLAHHLSAKMSIENPTMIQRTALPSMLQASSTSPASLQDVFIQSQTGSGKTLTYLLPIIHSLLPLSSQSYIDRSIGTLAIILVPTRELAKQIYDVLEGLLSMNLSLPTAASSDETGLATPVAAPQQRLTRWLIPGLLTGGSTRTHEKARLRKGLPIIVSTPGRLLDHLQNTTSLDVSKLRWLVLDEADRLMDLGFEETIKGILKSLDGRRKLALESLKDGGRGGTVGGWDWDIRRRTVLCSATVREDVQALAGVALVRPKVFRGVAENPNKLVSAVKTASKKKDVESSTVTKDGEEHTEAQEDEVEEEEEEKFTPPSQLMQSHIVVPPKLRLVTLVALLRSLCSPKKEIKDAKGQVVGKKVIVFLSTTDSVDFHWKMLGGIGMGGKKETEDGEENRSGDEDGDDSDEDGKDEEDVAAVSSSESEIAEPKTTSKKKSKKPKTSKKDLAIKSEPITQSSVLLPQTTLHRLHGSLPLQTRLASLKSFATPSPTSAVLFCTSVASRGLDLPLVRAVVQYDLPTEGGVTEYVHRVGRTARVGKGGEAWCFVGNGPEEDWVPWIEGKMGGGVRVKPVGVEGVVKVGLGGGKNWENRATEVQGAMERWVLGETKNATLAQKAFQSYVRSYSTHPSEEKRFFHLKNLHLGHLAKAFALRDAPSSLPGSSAAKKTAVRPAGSKWDRDDDEGKGDAEKRMQEAVRRQGRLTKSGGVLGVVGTGDYQIADVGALEKFAKRKDGAGGGGGGKRKRN
ncbi:dead-domain-containing protein [Phaffia rhodozyma]|uniref:ATP-dependent RNA helicase n=1 Tax=Phaffia rhodozyma TaxID=264483 RepID=A0A0F7STW5_PHARH|nr:dead-domain-containing protein [Phaffia rhodozyma]